MNDGHIRSGHFDKVQTPQSESGTARPALSNGLKHRSGLQVLSSFILAAFSERQEIGKVVASSAFKPPPRVTLVDAKRESWLKELSNPSISLRRLSRTIPHGIRGKALLDHCMEKDIPTSRAVWLAKCVGANEIRAFKRKVQGGVIGVGGERKWIRDWTSNLEQFLDNIFLDLDKPSAKLQLEYGYVNS